LVDTDINIETLSECLLPEHEIDLEIQKELLDLGKKFILLVVEKSPQSGQLTLQLIKHFFEESKNGVCVSINKPVEDLLKGLETKCIEQKELVFVDCVSKMAGMKEISEKNFIYVDSPKQLLELSEAIDAAMALLAGKSFFVLIDSLSTLFVYNEERSVEKFVHTTATKMRTLNVKGIFLVTQEKKHVIQTLSQFADKTIYL